MKLTDVIGFDFRKGDYTIGEYTTDGKKLENTLQASVFNQADVDTFLAQYAKGGAEARDDHALLGQAIVEPIVQVVPYMELYAPVFFDEVTYGSLDDNSIPVEDTVAMGFETHQDGAVQFVRSGFSWTRPDFTTFDTGIEVPWEALRKAGWNFLARQMKRATEELARKRDVMAKGVMDTAFINNPSLGYNVTGGKLTKAAVDSVLKAKAQIGFPVRRVLVNSGTIMDMASFTWPTGLYLPDQEAREIIKNLYIGNYGGAEWYINPFAPTDTVYFGGLPNQIGWHQLRGAVSTASDVDITNKVDKHAIYDAEHAFYIGNVWTLAKLTIGA